MARSMYVKNTSSISSNNIGKSKKPKKKSGLMDLISRNQIKQLILDDDEEDDDHGHGHSHGHAHGSSPKGSGASDSSPIHGHTHGHGHGQKKKSDFDHQDSFKTRSNKLQEALHAENADLSHNLSHSDVSPSPTPENTPPRIEIGKMGVKVDKPGEEDNTSKSSLDSDHETHESLDDENLDHSQQVKGDKAQNDAQAELQFNILMNKMIKHCPSRLVASDIFKYGTDAITYKSYEAELSQSVDELRIALEKSKNIQNIIQKEFESKKHQNSILISSNIVFNFEKMQEHRQKMKELELQTEKSVNDQKKLQKWLQNAIIQNEGQFECHRKSLVYERKSLGLFKYDSRLRRMIVWLTEWKNFDRFVIFLIVLGSICQALDSQVDYDQNTEQTKLIKKVLDQILEYSSYLFIMEALLKIISQGLISHKNAYLRDGWNVVDFIVVMSSIFEIIVKKLDNVNLPEVNYLRTFRVIRPLRSVKRIPSMRRLVTIMLRSLPELANTLVFMLFFFIVFGIVGVQTFHGVIYQRCRLTKLPVNGVWKIDPDQADFICNTDPGMINSCKAETYCGSTVTYSQNHEENLDLMQDDPWSDEIILYNTVNFNNIMHAICAIFEALTLEGWSIQMYMLMDTNSTNLTIAIFFYLILVVFGSYFVLNLILAVIMGSFTKFETAEYEQKMRIIEQEMLKQVGTFVVLGDAPHQEEKQAKKESKDKHKENHSNDDNSKSSIQEQNKKKPVLDFRLQPEPTASEDSHTPGKQSKTPAGSEDSAFSFSNQIYAVQSLAGKSQQKIEIKKTNEAETPNVVTSKQSSPELMKIQEKQHSLDIAIVQRKTSGGQNAKKSEVSLKDSTKSDEIKKLNSDLKSINQDKNFGRKMTSPEAPVEKKANQSKLTGIKKNFTAKNNERIDRNALNFTQQNSKISQNSILEISNEDDYSNDYEEKQNYAQPYNSKASKNNSPSIEFDNFMEGGDKVNVTDDYTPQSISNRGGDTFTQLAVLNQSKQQRSTKIAASSQQSPSLNTSYSPSVTPNSRNQSATLSPDVKNDEMGWSSVFSTSQRKQTKRRSKNRSLGGRIAHAFNGTIRMSSKRYANSDIYYFFGYICSNKYFNIIILLCIAMNTITLSMDRYPIEVKTANRLEEINKISTWIFVGELAIKVLGLGIQTYARDSMNQFDAIVVIISIIEIVLSNQQKREQSSEDEDIVTKEENMSLTIFRGFRLLRVFRLFSKWKTFHKMIIKIGETLKDIITFFFLLLIIVFVFSLLGVELFKNKAKINRFNDIVKVEDPLGYSPRQNFDDFLNAFVSVFVCLIGEDWQLIMHDYVRASKSMVVQTYFIILMIIGNLFLMNLFLAILLKNFEDKKRGDDEDKDAEEKEKEEEDFLNINYLQKSMKIHFRRVFYKKTVEPAPEKPLVQPEDKEIEYEESGDFSDNDDIKVDNLDKSDRVQDSSSEDIKIQPQIENPSANTIDKEKGIQDKDRTLNAQHSAEIHLEGGYGHYAGPARHKSMSSNKSLNDSKNSNMSGEHQVQQGRLSVQAKKKIAKSTINVLQKKRRTSKLQSRLMETGKVLKLTGRSLFIFAKDNPCRVALAKLVVHQFFELFIFFTVLLSAVLMMADGPLIDPNHSMKPLIDTCNLAITIIFMAELVLKVIAMGFIMHQHSYMRDGWNVLDFVIVAFSIASLIVESQSDGNNNQSAKTLELFKMLRVLRSLRMISKSEGLKLSVLSLIYSMPGILNVAIVSLLFLILLGIFFLNLFKGKFHYCDLTVDIDENIQVNQVLNKFDCINYGGNWKNSEINFDGIGESLTALFVMCTTEGWVAFMNQANDSMGIGIQPVRNANPVYQYVFILYMIFGSLFITNLFIEVVINTFDQEKKAIDKNYRLTKFQKEWIQLQLKCYDVFPEAKINTNYIVRDISLKIVENKYFDPFIMAMILFNAVTLAMIWVGMSTQWLGYLEFFSDIFNYIFILECALKLIAYQKVYFKNGWNNFDFFIVICGIWGLLRQNDSSQISILRILRVGRLLRLLKRAKRLYIIFNSFISTIPAFLNVGGLILVIIFITSVLGQRFFADVMISGSLDKYRNFQTPRNSLITLILVMTGEGWYEIMADLGRPREIDFPCIHNPTYKDYAENDYNTVGCGKAISKPFFIIYVILVSLILVNLFIAVTLQGFNDVSSQDSCRITDMQISLFIDVWKEIDPDGTGYIHISEAASLMRNLIEKKCDLFPSSAKDLVYDPSLLQELIEHLQLKLYKKFQYYNFHDILISLSQMYLQQLANSELEEIFEEFKQIHQDTFEAEDLDDVIEKIDEIMKEQNVQLCRKLEKTLNIFRNDVLHKIDRFEGNIYNSSMIPIVIKIQQIFRDKRRARALIEAEQAKLKKFDRKNVQKQTKLDQYDLSASDDDENMDLEAYIKKRDKIAAKIKKKLDDIIHGCAKDNEDANAPTLQEMINRQTELKKIIKKKELELETIGRVIDVSNSREEFAFLNKKQQDETLEELLNIDQKKKNKARKPIEFPELQTIKLTNYTRLEADEIKEALNSYIKQKKLNIQEPAEQKQQDQKQKLQLQQPQKQQLQQPQKSQKALKSPKKQKAQVETYINIKSAEQDIQSLSDSVESIIKDDPGQNKFRQLHKEALDMREYSSNEEIDAQDKNVFPKQIMKSDLKPFQNYSHYSRQNYNFQQNTFESNSFDYIDKKQRSSNQYSNIQSIQTDGQFKGLFEQDQLRIPGKVIGANKGSNSNLFGSNRSKKSKESQELIDSRRNPVTEDISPHSQANEQIDSFARVHIESIQEQQQQQIQDNHLNLNIDTNQIQSRQINQQDQQQSVQTASLRRKHGSASSHPHKMRGGQPSQPKKSQQTQQRTGQDSMTLVNRGTQQMAVADGRHIQTQIDRENRESPISFEQSTEEQPQLLDTNKPDLVTNNEQSTIEKVQSPSNLSNRGTPLEIQVSHFSQIQQQNSQLQFDFEQAEQITPSKKKISKTEGTSNSLASPEKDDQTFEQQTTSKHQQSAQFGNFTDQDK